DSRKTSIAVADRRPVRFDTGTRRHQFCPTISLKSETLSNTNSSFGFRTHDTIASPKIPHRPKAVATIAVIAVHHVVSSPNGCDSVANIQMCEQKVTAL